MHQRLQFPQKFRIALWTLLDPVLLISIALLCHPQLSSKQKVSPGLSPRASSSSFEFFITNLKHKQNQSLTFLSYESSGQKTPTSEDMYNDSWLDKKGEKQIQWDSHCSISFQSKWIWHLKRMPSSESFFGILLGSCVFKVGKRLLLMRNWFQLNLSTKKTHSYFFLVVITVHIYHFLKLTVTAELTVMIATDNLWSFCNRWQILLWALFEVYLHDNTIK